MRASATCVGELARMAGSYRCVEPSELSPVGRVPTVVYSKGLQAAEGT